MKGSERKKQKCGQRAITFVRRAAGTWPSMTLPLHPPHAQLRGLQGTLGQDGSSGEPSPPPQQHPPMPQLGHTRMTHPVPRRGKTRPCTARPMPLLSGQPLTGQYQTLTPPGGPMSSAGVAGIKKHMSSPGRPGLPRPTFRLPEPNSPHT